MQDPPDAAKPMPDAPKPPIDAPLKGFGATCTDPNECQSGLCVGEANTPHICSRTCTLQVAHDCKDVDAFCVPISGGGNACYGMIETGNDLDDAIVEIGDTVTRAVTPLGDADLFQVRLNQLGNTLITVTPQPSIDVRLEAYGVLGSPLGIANDAGPGQPEALSTDVQQIGGHVWFVVRNVGTATGNYTLTVQHTAMTARAIDRDTAVQ